MDQWMKLLLQLLSLDYFHSSKLPVVLKKIHDIIKWNFPSHHSPTSWYFFLLSFFFASYNYFLSCVTCPYISGSLRNKVCFRCLANGELLASLGYFFGVWKKSVQGIVRESGKVIWKVEYCNPTSEIWLRIADQFNDICKMPNCMGSRERKHCRIKCPPNAGSFYFNPVSVGFLKNYMKKEESWN